MWLSWSLPTPDIGEILSNNCTIEQTKIKKEAGNGPSLKNNEKNGKYTEITNY